MSQTQDDSDLVAARDFIETKLLPLVAEFERESGMAEHLSAVVLLLGAVENAWASGYPLEMVEDMCRRTWEKCQHNSGQSLGMVHETPRGQQ